MNQETIDQIGEVIMGIGNSTAYDYLGKFVATASFAMILWKMFRLRRPAPEEIRETQEKS